MRLFGGLEWVWRLAFAFLLSAGGRGRRGGRRSEAVRFVVVVCVVEEVGVSVNCSIGK